jgi:LysR family transcriptional regulator, glycine cleavage system transcriptional activator
MATRLKRPADLRNETLLRVAHAADDWPRWFKALQLSIRAKGPEFEYYGQALQAAVDGVGIAMGIRPYVDDDLQSGRLVTPFARSVSKGEHWYLIYRNARKDESAFQAFRTWIMRAAYHSTQQRYRGSDRKARS